MKDNKGFTLVELLTVIVILGILAMVAIPAVSRYIDNSKKQSYITSVKVYAQAVQKAYHSNLLDCSGKVGKYYVSFSDAKVLIQDGGSSPFGGSINGSIRIDIDNTGESVFHVYSYDNQNFGTALVELTELDPSNRNLIKKSVQNDNQDLIDSGYVKCVVIN